MTDSERLCFCAFFFSKPGGFSVELYRKSFALKNRFGNEASSPQPLKHFYPGKTSNACMLLAHRLMDLGMFTYNSLQAAYCLSLYLHFPFSPSFLIIPALKVVPIHKLGVVQFKRKLKVRLVLLSATMYQIQSRGQRTRRGVV